MSLIRLVPAGLHALGDYLAGLVLIVVGGFCMGPGTARATGIVLGVSLMVVSLLTRSPLGVVPVIPFPAHSAGDYLAGVLAIVAPFVVGFYDQNPGVAATYIAVGAVVIVLSLVTDYLWEFDHLGVRPDPQRSAVPTGRQ